MPFCPKPLGAALSTAAIAAVTMASPMISPGRAQQDPPAAGQGTAIQTPGEAKQPQVSAPDAQAPAASAPTSQEPSAGTPAASVPSSQAPSLGAAAAPPTPKRPSQLASAHRGSAKSAVVTAKVNLRSGPGTDSEVIATIPAGSPVRAADCSEWCAVTWNGHRGYAIARNIGFGTPRQAYSVQPGYAEHYELEPPVIYGGPDYYAPPAIVYGPAYYGPRIYYGPAWGWGWRRRWW